MKGSVHCLGKPHRGKMEFSFEIVRLCEWPVRKLLESGLGVLPLAVLGRLPDGVSGTSGLRSVLYEIEDRLKNEADDPKAKELLTAALVLSRLRMSRDESIGCFQELPK